MYEIHNWGPTLRIPHKNQVSVIRRGSNVYSEDEEFVNRCKSFSSITISNLKEVKSSEENKITPKKMMRKPKQ